MRDVSVKRWSAFHKALFKTTSGLIGKRLVDNDVLLLTTVGAKHGAPHTVPLLYLHDGDSLVVVASYGGRPHHPDWYINLDANPRVEVQILGTKADYSARTATDSERKVWWPRIVEAYSGYADYQVRTDRVIPVVFLEPM